METDPQKMAALMLGLRDATVVEVVEDSSGLQIEVVSQASVGVCGCCGRPGEQVGVENFERRGAPVFGRATVLVWRLRRWRCGDPACRGGEWLDELPASAGGDGSQ